METLENVLKASFLIIIVYSDAPPIVTFWACELCICLLMEKARYENNLKLMPLRKKQKPGNHSETRDRILHFNL